MTCFMHMWTSCRNDAVLLFDFQGVPSSMYNRNFLLGSYERLCTVHSQATGRQQL